MHIIIAAITAIAGLLWALNTLQRSGFDLNSLNPFFWARRRRWELKQVNPLYAIESARELAAVLTFAIMRQGGDPTEEQKANLLALYESELKYAKKDATEMYSVASHLLNTDPNYMHKVKDLVAPCRAEITEEQKLSILTLIQDTSITSSALNTIQAAFAKSIEAELKLDSGK